MDGDDVIGQPGQQRGDVAGGRAEVRDGFVGQDPQRLQADGGRAEVEARAGHALPGLRDAALQQGASIGAGSSNTNNDDNNDDSD